MCRLGFLPVLRSESLGVCVFSFPSLQFFVVLLLSPCMYYIPFTLDLYGLFVPSCIFSSFCFPFLPFPFYNAFPYIFYLSFFFTIISFLLESFLRYPSVPATFLLPQHSASTPDTFLFFPVAFHIQIDLSFPFTCVVPSRFPAAPLHLSPQVFPSPDGPSSLLTFPPLPVCLPSYLLSSPRLIIITIIIFRGGVIIIKRKKHRLI